MKLRQKFMAACAFILLGSCMTVQAGSINSAEASVIAAAQAVFEYDGKSYTAAGWCIDMLYSKFSEDSVDLSSTQASALINMGYSNIARGVAEGYLLPVGGSEEESAAEAAPETEMPREPESSQDDSNTEEKTQTEDTKDKNDQKNPENSASADDNNIPENETGSPQSEPYVRENVIAGLGAPEKDEHKHYFLRFMLLKIYGLLPDLVQKTLEEYITF